MQFWYGFIRYSQWALEFLLVPPFIFVTVALGLAAAITIFLSWKSLRPNWKRWHWTIFLQFLAIPLVLAVAVFGTVPVPASIDHRPPRWAEICVEILSWGSLLFGVVCIWRMKGLRGMATVSLLCCQWILQGALLIASSATTGVWP